MAARHEQQTVYLGREIAVISCIQFVITVVSSLFANYLLSSVSFISHPNLSFKIFSFAYGSLVFVVLLSKSKTRWTLIQLMKFPAIVTVFAMIFHVIAVLYGAPFLANTEETFVWALVMAVLCIVPPCCVLGADLDTLYRLCVSNWSEYTVESYFQQCIALTIFGAWLGAFPIPLDWDRPWQAWPIPCAIGGLLGHVIGLVLSGIGFFLADRRDRRKLV